MSRIFKYLLISVHFIVLPLSSSENRRLIAIIDILDDDFQDAHKTLNGKIILPGPECYILRNALRDEYSPIFVSKNIFQIFYNFFTFANKLINAHAPLEDVYAHSFSTKEYEYLSKIKKLVDLLLLQYQEAHNYINQSINNQKISLDKKLTVALDSMEFLKKKNIFLDSYLNLTQQLQLNNQSIILAETIITFYKAFNAQNWDLYVTKNDNYILYPKTYPAADFNKNKLRIKQPQDSPFIKKEFKDPFAIITYEGKLLIHDLDYFINNIPFNEKKPLDFIMIGHGSLGSKSIQVGGLLSQDFQKLVTVLGQANTRTFFYISCHNGGMTAKNVWFADHSIKDDVQHSFQNKFTTIVSPVTERPFVLFSPLWIRAWLETINNPRLLGSLITSNMLPYVAVPNFKQYFEYIPYSLSKAINFGLYNPLKTIFRDNKSDEVSQLALIKFPGTDWFSPEFLSNNIIEITKTTSALASFEKKPIVQLPNQIIVAISTPIIYATLVIENTKNLRILSLLPQDSAYKNTSNDITTYVKKVIIKDPACKKASYALKTLSAVIAPCSVIACDTSSKTPLFRKNFFIEEVVNAENKTIATQFAVTGYGTFFINNKTLYYIDEKNKITSDIPNQLRDIFEEVCNSAEQTIIQDKKKNSHTQTVTHKIGVMEKINNVIASKLALMKENKKFANEQ